MAEMAVAEFDLKQAKKKMAQRIFQYEAIILTMHLDAGKAILEQLYIFVFGCYRRGVLKKTGKSFLLGRFLTAIEKLFHRKTSVKHIK